MARPSNYSIDTANMLCAEIATGKSLRKVCSTKGQPSLQTVYDWFSRHPEFIDQYARAKDDSADADQDRLDDIAEKVLTGKLCEKRARVAADIIKWSASKKKPKKYGDRIQQDLNVNDYNALTDDELNREIAALEQEDKSINDDVTH